MATGANDEYWGQQALPSVFKHTLLDTYVPQFAGMTGARTAGRRVVYLDGYAGRGRYADGSPASAERILQIAQHQARHAALSWTCFFVEQNPASARVLAEVISEYAGEDVAATVHRGDVATELAAVVKAAAGAPLFLFLDPCGVGVPFDVLVDLLARRRPHRWPPTEVLINFSLEAVRRIGGHVASPNRNDKSVARLDSAVDGNWWHRLFAEGTSDAAVAALVEEFVGRLGAATGMHVAYTPVRRAPNHKPLYHLVFGTRSNHGVWVFGDSIAVATQRWWDALEEVEADEEPNALFTATSTIRPQLSTVETRAVPVIAANLASILDQHGPFKVVDHPMRVFGPYYGRVRDRVVRDAVKLLHSQGRTATTAVGVRRARDIVVTRP